MNSTIRTIPKMRTKYRARIIHPKKLAASFILVVTVICGCREKSVTEHNGLYINNSSPSVIIWVINGDDITIYYEGIGHDTRRCIQDQNGVKFRIGSKTRYFLADGQGNLRLTTLGARMIKLSRDGNKTPGEIRNMMRGLEQLDSTAKRMN